MAEYIDKQAALADLNETYDKMAGFHPQFYNGYQFALNQLREFPTADVAEVRHGRWEKFRVGKDDYILRLRCTCCRKVVYEREFNYCPNCGADMRGADNGG